MKFAFIVNFDKDKSLEIANKVISLLNGNELITNEFTANKFDYPFTVSASPLENADIVIVIGGDGTIIHTSKKAAEYSKPVLGINTGRIGYLAAVQPGEIDKITAILSEKYILEERLMLNIDVNKNGKSFVYTAFNDAVLSKGSLSRMIDISSNLNNQTYKYRADGLIVSTPTGSTAYSLSAGGPVLDYGVKGILITPICPYSFFNKSLVVSEKSEIRITVDTSENKEAFLTIDGESSIKIENGDTVTVSKSEKYVKLIKFPNSNNNLNS